MEGLNPYPPLKAILKPLAARHAFASDEALAPQPGADTTT
jgi:hypothetical protein